MALIKCPECGSEISDKASFCIHCGFSLDKVNDVGVADDENTETVKETQPVGVSKKKIILVVIVVLAVVIVLVCFLVNHLSTNNDDLYNNVAWGTSYDDTEDSAIGQILISDEDSIMEMIEDYNGQTGVTAVITYDFSLDGTLHAVEIMFMLDDDSEYTAGMLWEEYVKEFSESFGEGETQDVSYSSMTWTTSKSEIHIEYAEFLESVFYLGYSDVNTLE